MKKLVNGRVVDINNMELFELAAEGLALQNMAVSNTADAMDAELNSAIVRKYIKQYDLFFKLMPYPLYAIEKDIKYATLGNFINSLSQEPLCMWVDNGLHIKIDIKTGMTLKIVNNTWSIVYVTESKKDNTCMDLYKSNIGFEEYSWVLKKILHKETTADFYKEFMPNFVAACNEQPIILKWELENILTFSTIPKKMNFKQNRIINLNNEEEYLLDIYCNGTAELDEPIQTWSFTSSGVQSAIKKKQIKTFGYDAYKKIETSSKLNSKITKCDIVGLNNMFMELCGIRSANDMVAFPTFEGAIFDTYITFVIEKRLFVSKSNRLSDVKDIAHGVELYAIENGKIYFIKSKKVNDKISKDTLYSYNIKDENIRICKIIFSY